MADDKQKKAMEKANEWVKHWRPEQPLEPPKPPQKPIKIPKPPSDKCIMWLMCVTVLLVGMLTILEHHRINNIEERGYGSDNSIVSTDNSNGIRGRGDTPSE